MKFPGAVPRYCPDDHGWSVNGGRMKSGAWLPRALATAALTTTAVLCLTSCGGADAPRGDESPPASASSGAELHPGIFRAELPNGASVKITVPAREAPDKKLEQLRREAEVPRATYATVDIDNRAGHSPVSASRVVLTARDGATYQLEHVARGLKRWQPRPSGARWVTRGGTTLDDHAARRLTERISAAARCSSRDIPVGEQGRNILVGDISAVPRDFASLELIPLIGDRETAPVQVRPESGGSSGAPDGPGSPEEKGSRGPGHEGSSRAPGEQAPPENPLPDDPQPSDPASPAVPGPVVPGPVDPPPVDSDPAVPPPVDSDPAVPPPVVPGPVVPPPVVPDPVPTVPPVPVPVPPEPEPTAPGDALPDPPAPDPVVSEAAPARPVDPPSTSFVAPVPDRLDTRTTRVVLPRVVPPRGVAPEVGAAPGARAAPGVDAPGPRRS